jgi:hypothetical protein
LRSFDYLIDEDCTRDEIEKKEQELHELKEHLRELEETRRNSAAERQRGPVAGSI